MAFKNTIKFCNFFIIGNLMAIDLPWKIEGS